MVHLLFGPEVRQMLQEDDGPGMTAFLETLHPATVAEALADEALTVEQVWSFLKHTNIRTQAAIFEYFPIDMQVKLAEGAGRQDMAHLIEKMSHDDRVDLLRRLMPRVAESLLRLVDEADRRDIAQLVSYPENSAGAMMTTDYAWVPANITAGEALDRLRLQAPDRETIYYVFVLDDQRKLQGVVSLRELILKPKHAVIRDIMDREAVTVRVTDDREKVARELARYDLLAIPVLDAEGRLVGIVTYDDAIDVVVQEATEDVHRMGAVGPIEENYLHASFLKVWRNRALWLACLFGAELLTFSALAHFEDAIKAVVVLALFVPLCISTGGNSGSQAATLITRAMALGQVGIKDWWIVLRHEIVMGVALGLTLGVIGLIRGAATPSETLSSPEKRTETFFIRVPKDRPLKVLDDGSYDVPKDRVAEDVSKVEKTTHIHMPRDSNGNRIGEPVVTEDGNNLLYQFPENSEVSTDPVDRWRLGIVIAQAVCLICLWGTLVGSMLPIIFKRLGVDPGIASSPFVATFVDVTGIVIYFSIAKVWLLS
jgi:magnesium transporter